LLFTAATISLSSGKLSPAFSMTICPSTVTANCPRAPTMMSASIPFCLSAAAARAARGL
jgi:hypothetical protein